jgi:endoglucanase
MHNNSFNGIRLPFSCDTVYENPIPNGIDYRNNKNQDLIGLSSLEVMDKIIESAGRAGMLIMLDMHSLEHDNYNNNGLWYDSTYSQNDTLAIWKFMVDRYKNTWNVVAMDVFNEPFAATWGLGDESTDFNTWCQIIGDMAHASGANWLVMCEGTFVSPPTPDWCFYGGDLIGVASTPVVLETPDKVVYCPHAYGPNMYNESYFNAPDFPKNMPGIWNTHWGYIRGMNNSATTVGEWGGPLKGQSGVWMKSFVEYLLENDTPDTWYFCLNANGGGLLEPDWTTPKQDKLDMLVGLMPYPTVVTYDETTGVICLDFQ